MHIVNCVSEIILSFEICIKLSQVSYHLSCKVWHSPQRQLWHFPGLSSCSFLAMSSSGSWILPHSLLQLWGAPILTRGAMKPRSSPGLRLSGVWQYVLLNTWENKWHLIHRNKTTSKYSNGFSCSQESPQLPQHHVLLIEHCPLQVLVSTSTQIQDSSVSSSSTLPNFQIPIHFLCIAISYFIVISFWSMSSEHHLLFLMQINKVFPDYKHLFRKGMKIIFSSRRNPVACQMKA